jgi:hypothetical protein
VSNIRTTICGALAAGAGALAAVPGLDARVHLAAVACAAVAVALLGFFAAEARPPSSGGKLGLFLATTGVLVAPSIGCSVQGLRASAIIPTFGQYVLEIPGGSIGRYPQTNQPTTNPIPKL